MNDDAEYSESGVRIHRHEAKEKPFQIAEGDAEALEAIEDHIEKHIGKIETVMRELASDLVHIDVHNELLDINRRNVCHKRFGIF